MTEMVTSGSMSGDGRRSDGLLGECGYERCRTLQAPPALYATAPCFDSTEPIIRTREVDVTVVVWPAAGLVAVIAAMIIFRAPITRWIDRVRSVNAGKYGINADSIPPGQQPRGAEQAAPGGVVLDLEAVEAELRSMDNAIVVRNERLVRQALEQLQPDQRERTLLRYAVATAVQVRFERNYSVIWGSQIAVLQSLNAVAAATVDQVRGFYDKAHSEFPTVYEAYSFEQWLGFLESNSLVVTSATGVSISIDGREFLKYLIDRGYFLWKPN